MTEVKKSYGEKLVDDAIAEREAKVRAEQRLIISKALGMTLEQLEELIKKSNPLES